MDWQNYTTGVHQVSDGVWTYLQPNGSWGLNNLALVASGDRALMIDTCVDLPRTQAVIAGFKAATPAADPIDSVFLTHWHVDHANGICAPELADSEIITSKICAEYLASMPPAKWLATIGALTGDARRQIAQHIGDKFDFTGLAPRAPDRVFEGSTDIQVGDRQVSVIETKPSHTRSDSMVFVADAGVVHTGDLIAGDRHIGLQYPFLRHLLAAYDQLISWDAAVYIPGHGPLLTIEDVRAVREYLLWVQGSARASYDAGDSAEAAAEAILEKLGDYRKLKGPHTIFSTVRMMYLEFAGDEKSSLRQDYPAHLAAQWKLRESLKQRHPELYAPF